MSSQIDLKNCLNEPQVQPTPPKPPPPPPELPPAVPDAPCRSLARAIQLRRHNINCVNSLNCPTWGGLLLVSLQTSPKKGANSQKKETPRFLAGDWKPPILQPFAGTCSLSRSQTGSVPSASCEFHLKHLPAQKKKHLRLPNPPAQTASFPSLPRASSAAPAPAWNKERKEKPAASRPQAETPEFRKSSGTKPSGNRVERKPNAKNIQKATKGKKKREREREREMGQQKQRNRQTHETTAVQMS